MAVNTDVGWQYGYLPWQWEAMSPAQRAQIKAQNTVNPSPSSGVAMGPSSNTVAGIGPIGAAAGFQPAPSSSSVPAGFTGLPPADNGASDTGMTGGTASYAAPTRQLSTSPEWQAYLSALGLEEMQARADVDRMRGLYTSEAERLKQDLVPQYGQQRRGISGSLEARGMARSGELLRRLAENRAQEGRQRAGIESNLAGQVGQLESQLAQKMGSMASQRAQQELSLRSQGYV